MNERAPLTPKEVADLVFGGKRSERWVRNECRRFINTRGRRGIAVLCGCKPYLIPRSEAARLGLPLFAQRCASTT